MTHEEIYIRFMIEYDKANVTSSYPSLTEYEVAVMLDKAYNALIAQKLTGNNFRRSAFETDIKAIEDLRPLVTTKATYLLEDDTEANNVAKIPFDKDLLYFLQCKISKENRAIQERELKATTSYTGSEKGFVPVKLVDHNMATNFYSNTFNTPWVKEPVCFVENDNIYVVYDPYDKPETISKNVKEYSEVLTYNVGSMVYTKNQDDSRAYWVCTQNNTTNINPAQGDSLNWDEYNKATITFIKKPHTFFKTDSLRKSKYDTNNAISDNAGMFSYKLNTGVSENDADVKAFMDAYTFELSDTVAEELISLAIAFTLENVESPRLNSKLNMRGLEA